MNINIENIPDDIKKYLIIDKDSGTIYDGRKDDVITKICPEGKIRL